MTELTQLQRLAEHFPAADVKKDPKGHHYISIDAIQQRLDDVLGVGWHLTVLRTDGPSLLPTAEVTYGAKKKPAFVATVTVMIEAEVDGSFVRRAGVGSDLADDPDKVVKTALANAIKKAANQFGVGRYLWDEDERKGVDNAKLAIAGNSAALKREAAKLAKKLTGKTDPTKAEIAKALGIKVGDLTDDDALRGALEEHGVL